MATVEDWVKSPQAQAIRIDGQHLFNKTVGKLSAEGTAKGGCGGIFAAGWILAPVFGVPLLILIFLAAGGLEIAQGILGCYGVIILACIFGGIWLFNSPSTESKQRMRDPIPATDLLVQSLGARSILPEEKEKIVETLQQVMNKGAGQLQAPDNWMVDPSFSAFPQVMGRVALLTRSVLDSPNLPAVITYLLFRIANGDGVMLLSLSPLKPLPERLEDGTFAPPEPLPYAEEWRAYWRQQVFQADDFVMKMGYGRQLVNYLNSIEPMEKAQPHLLQEEPYIAERISRMQQLMR